MPDVPKMDFVDALAEIWFQINFAAYHVAYVRVYSQSEAMRTNAGVLRNQEQLVRDHVQVDIVICVRILPPCSGTSSMSLRPYDLRSYADKRNIRQKSTSRHTRSGSTSSIRQEIKDYRNMAHQIHFLPTIGGHQLKGVEMNTRLHQYLEYAANVWLEFAPGDFKSKFPTEFRFPVTIPYLFSGELPKELQGVRQLEVHVESYDGRASHAGFSGQDS